MNEVSNERLVELIGLLEDAATKVTRDDAMAAFKDTALALLELAEYRQRYGWQENQRLCIGFNGGCDGDLEGIAHNSNCPSYAVDKKNRPYLYEKEDAQPS